MGRRTGMFSASQSKKTKQMNSALVDLVMFPFVFLGTLFGIIPQKRRRRR